MLTIPPVEVSKITFVPVFLLNRTFDNISVVPSCARDISFLYSVLVGVYISNSAFPGML